MIIPPAPALLAWIPIVVSLFRQLSIQWAIVVSFVTGFLYLSQFEFEFPLLIPGTRMAITTYAVFLGIILFNAEAKRLFSFRLSWFDLPMIVWWICPFISSISNDLGIFDGLKELGAQTIIWVLPYLLGRIYLRDLEGLRKLCLGMIVGTLSYMPLCWIEMRLSPILHQTVYGFDGSGGRIGQNVIEGVGYRPIVFQAHGLVVGAWFMSAAVISVWLWKSGTIHRLFGLPFKWLAIAIVVQSFLTRSLAATVFFCGGVFIFFVSKYLRNFLPLLAISFCILIYLHNGISGSLAKDGITAAVSGVTSESKTESLQFRLNSEDVLVDKANQRMWFGWGGNGRNRVIDQRGYEYVTDSLWIIVYGTRGLTGLVSITLVFLLPSLLLIFYFPTAAWHHRRLAPVAALSVVLALNMADALLNAFPHPLLTISAGGILGLFADHTQSRTVGVALSAVDPPALATSAIAPLPQRSSAK
ncbi:MAG: O-antigen ligase domain-containing protein [Cyanobacteriota bacterium]